MRGWGRCHHHPEYLRVFNFTSGNPGCGCKLGRQFREAVRQSESLPVEGFPGAHIQPGYRCLPVFIEAQQQNRAIIVQVVGQSIGPFLGFQDQGQVAQQVAAIQQHVAVSSGPVLPGTPIGNPGYEDREGQAGPGIGLEKSGRLSGSNYF